MENAIEADAGSAKEPSKPLDTMSMTEDAVFGVMTEEGPNYRNVSLLLSLLTTSTDSFVGWRPGSDSSYDEDPVWARCAFNTQCIRLSGHDPRNNMCHSYCNGDDLVKLCDRRLQAKSPRSILYRRCRRLDVWPSGT